MPTDDLLQGRPVLVAHKRRHHLYQTALAYRQINRLGAFLTTVYVHRPSLLAPMAVVPIKALSRRVKKLAAYHEPSLSDQVWIHPQGAIAAIAWKLLGAHKLIRSPEDFATVAGRLCVEHQWACHMACTQALPAFQACRNAGLPCVLEQYGGDRRAGRQLLTDELTHWGLRPEKLTQDGPFSQEMVERNEAEYELADVVISISAFVTKTLTDRGIEADRIRTVPLGVDTSLFPPRLTTRLDQQPLQVAFVGSNGIYKGVLYLFEAIKKLGRYAAHVHVYGHLHLPEQLLDRYRPFVTLHGHVDRKSLADGFYRCHAVALPSLWEGFGLAVYEGMSAGLPAIVSENTGAAVRDGVDGFVVPIRDSDAIAHAITRLRDEPARQAMARAAVETAGQNQWERYRRQLVDGLGLRRFQSTCSVRHEPRP